MSVYLLKQKTKQELCAISVKGLGFPNVRFAHEAPGGLLSAHERNATPNQQNDMVSK